MSNTSSGKSIPSDGLIFISVEKGMLAIKIQKIVVGCAVILSNNQGIRIYRKGTIVIHNISLTIAAEIAIINISMELFLPGWYK
jgi:hypothetical protein